MIGKTEILHLYLNDSKLNAPLTTKELKVQLIGLDHRMVSQEFHPLFSNPYSASINNFFSFSILFLKQCADFFGMSAQEIRKKAGALFSAGACVCNLLITNAFFKQLALRHCVISRLIKRSSQ